jgi:hypothetical protein
MSGRIEQATSHLEDEREALADERLADDELFDEALDRRPGLCHCVGGTNYCI